jgi:nicotinamidase-related amidase
MPNPSPPADATAPPRLSAADSSLLVIDVQDKLLAKMPDAPGLVSSVGFLIDAAKVLGVPVRATEQYPQGLGPTAVDLARRLPTPLPTKVMFSCAGAPGLMEGLRDQGRPGVVLAGMETHVCVLQTALDLLAAGYRVFLPADALQSRSAVDHDAALRRLERAGAVLTTAETTVFEWTGSAGHPRFKEISRLVKDRMNAKGNP